MSEVLNKLSVEFERTKRFVLCDMLAKCTKDQIELFSRIFPEMEVPSDKLDSAIYLVERTLKKNLELGR